MLLFVLFVANLDLEALDTEYDPSKLKEIDRVPIRIEFDLSMIEDDTDPLQCHNINDTVNAGYGEVKCNSIHIMTSEKINALKETFQNVADLANKLIKIHRHHNEITIKNVSALQITVKKDISQSDLFITVLARPNSNPDAPALASFLRASQYDLRPVQGYLVAHPPVIPSIPQSFESEQNWYFMVMFHELIHILGMHSSYFGNWMNRDTGMPFGNSIPIAQYINEEYSNRVHPILLTPQVRKATERQFGSSEFAPGFPMGMEIENAGGPSMAGHHPKGRLFLHDLMVALPMPQVKLSDLTLSLIEDMGWYTTNFSYATRNAWGSGEAIGIPKIDGFQRKSPQKVFPKQYLCQDDELDSFTTCSFDYVSVASCKMNTPVKCEGDLTDDDQTFCNNTSFYNPNNLSRRGVLGLFDYTLFRATRPNMVCRDTSDGQFLKTVGLSSKYGMQYGKESGCLRFSGEFQGTTQMLSGCFNLQCRNNVLFFEIEGKEYSCSSENEIIQIDSTSPMNVTCPDPQYLCSIRQFYQKVVPEPTRVLLPGDKPTQTPNESPYETIMKTPQDTLNPTPSQSPQPSNNSIKSFNPLQLVLYSSGFVLIIIIAAYIWIKLHGRGRGFEDFSNRDLLQAV